MIVWRVPPVCAGVGAAERAPTAFGRVPGAADLEVDALGRAVGVDALGRVVGVDAPGAGAAVDADGGGEAGWAAAGTAQSKGNRQAASSRTRLMRIKRLLPPLKRYCLARAATARIGRRNGQRIAVCLGGR